MSDQHYLVSARKYRPQTFSQLVAQDHVTRTLQNTLRLDRLAHAYLFSGPRGVGKTTAARILAKTINCENEEEEACRKCRSCKDFESGRSLSIFEIDAASNNKVEDIRDLQETVMIPPQGARRKVYIIDEVHMLSKSAFNALLKTLEEPPPHALFIFATTEPHKVLPTILSRCQRFDFRRIPVQDIVAHLQDICALEGVTADEESLLLIARKGDGALRDALSTFDQSVALCGTVLEYPVLTEALGVVTADHYFEASSHAANRDSPSMLRLVDTLMHSGYDIQEFLGGLGEHLRNLLVAKSMREASLIDGSDTTKARYMETCSHFSEPALLRMLMAVEQAQRTINTTSHARLRLELVLLKMTRMQDALALDEAVHKIDELLKHGDRGALPDFNQPVSQRPTRIAPPPVRQPRRGPSQRQVATPTPVEPPKPSPTPASSRPPQPEIDAAVTKPQKGKTQAPRNIPEPSAPEFHGQVSTTPVQSSAPENQFLPIKDEHWRQIVHRVESELVHIGSMLNEAKPLGLENDTLIIAVGQELFAEMLKSQEAYILRKISELSLPHIPTRLTIKIQKDLAPSPEADSFGVDPYKRFEERKANEPVVAMLAKQLELSVDNHVDFS